MLRGIHAVDDGAVWNFYAQDGLVRALVDDVGVVQSSMSFAPYKMHWDPTNYLHTFL